MPDHPVVTAAEQEGEWIEDLDVLPGHPEVAERIRAYEAQLERRPADWRLRLQLAQAHASGGDFASAASHLRACRGLVNEPSVMGAVFFNLGVCLENMDDWHGAAAAYERCLLLMPQLYWGRVGLGR